ncbi:hypothetical protein ACFSQ3_00750 [Sphingobacterium corticis]|uniref:Uncharacterized protein n=1 Tax=Sphingobacterium corticis TaxID=1812823 RepID=A0ABW5NER2_9SPHI
MSYSKNDVLAKVGELLVEVNEEYASVQEQGGELQVLPLGLLAAKVKYLSAHLDLLTQLATAPVLESAPAVTKVETVFTPARLPSEDVQQPATKNLEEAVSEAPNVAKDEQEEVAVAEEEASIEEEAEGESEYQEAEEEPIAEQAKPEADESTPKVKQEETEQEAEKVIPVSAWRTTTQEEASEEKEPEAIVRPVVEESRTIELPQAPAPATQAEPAAPSRPLTLNEMIQQQRREGLTNANQFKTPSSKGEQIVDLKTAVNLNDKLLFIKDLFNGYSLAYTEAIELLNRFDNMAEADAFLQANYALKNNWATKPQTVEKLYNILQRKFS